MQILLMDRQEGKTRQLVQWYMEDRPNRIMLVSTLREAENIHRQYFSAENWHQFLNKAILLAATAQEKLHGRRVTIGIDELESVLYCLLGAPVEIATVTA